MKVFRYDFRNNRIQTPGTEISPTYELEGIFNNAISYDLSNESLIYIKVKAETEEEASESAKELARNHLTRHGVIL